MTKVLLKRLLTFVCLFVFVFSSTVAAGEIPQSDKDAIYKDTVWHKIYPKCSTSNSGASGSNGIPGDLSPNEKVAAFVDAYGQMAYNDAIQSAVPWEVTLAQAIIESAYGQAAPGNNFFGIKADSSWTGPTQSLSTREEGVGQITDLFRVYASAQESFNDHSKFLRENGNYWPAFQFSNDPFQFLQKVKDGGYATANDYVQVVGSVMQQIIDYNATSKKFTPSSQIKFTVPPPGAGDTATIGGGGSSSSSCAQNQAGSLTLNYEDTTRPTRGVGPSRKLNTTVWYPGDSEQHPLVIFAGGYNQSPSAYQTFTQAIASKGFIVAAPSFPLADPAASGGVLNRDEEERNINQVDDIKFLIGKLLVEPQLEGQIDSGNITVVGHSDGADTALSAGYSARKDSRIKAVEAIAPDDTPGLGSGPPLLLMHSDSDTIAPYSGSVAIFAAIDASSKHFVTLLGADHFSSVAGSDPQTPAVDDFTTTFLANQTVGPTTDLKTLVDKYKQFVRME